MASRRTIAGPSDAIARGIGMVHQHFMLVPVFSVAENIVLGNETMANPVFLDTRKADGRIRDLARQLGFEIDPNALVGDLSVGIQQRIEILKALYRGAKVLILDEPTAVLTPQETAEIFLVLRRLAAEGTSIVFISHKLYEVLEIADRITVIRRGRVVGQADPKTATEEDLAEMMVGREVSLVVEKGPASPGDVVLRGRRCLGGGRPGLDRRGRALLRGAGGRDLRDCRRCRQRAGRAGRGADRPAQDPVRDRVPGRRMTSRTTPRATCPSAAWPTSPATASATASSSLPDRGQPRPHRTSTMPFSRYGVIDEGGDHEACRRPDPASSTSARRRAGIPTYTLSGGNQQKLIVAREFSRPISTLLIADQPTRGIDVGSIEFIHNQIVAKRDAGTAVLLVSAELDEIIELSDRIGMMYRGRLVAILDAETAGKEQVGLIMATGQAEVPA